ncbi:hypothetical protein PVAP13_3NG281382 [Panicum virgatum]|uniref:Uncharacterized protein n=1 Tax=Panicum virgatum TaxID=38727 RepID=A0A8T0UDS5_PANVG|nr:hypothetical protein PVAP13_3NG281382 [Panicum virgatum]
MSKPCGFGLAPSRPMIWAAFGPSSVDLLRAMAMACSAHLAPTSLGPFRGPALVDGLLRAAFRLLIFPPPRPLPLILPSAPATASALGGSSPILPSTPLLLALPWHPTVDPTAEAPLAPPPLPTSPAARASHPAPRGRGRRPRTSYVACPTNTQRNSARLAARSGGLFVDITSKAVQRKVLRESLANHSDDLKKDITSRRIFKRKHPIGVLDLRRLAKAAGLSCADQDVVAVAGVTTTAP